jgi:hypothetical protein
VNIATTLAKYCFLGSTRRYQSLSTGTGELFHNSRRIIITQLHENASKKYLRNGTRCSLRREGRRSLEFAANRAIKRCGTNTCKRRRTFRAATEEKVAVRGGAGKANASTYPYGAGVAAALGTSALGTWQSRASTFAISDALNTLLVKDFSSKTKHFALSERARSLVSSRGEWLVPHAKQHRLKRTSNTYR